MLDHVTFEVEFGTLQRPDFYEFMSALGMRSINVEEDVPERWNVAWFEAVISAPTDRRKHGQTFNVHVVERPGGMAQRTDNAGHFCVELGKHYYTKLKDEWTGRIERDSGSGRIWLNFGGLRVEAREAGTAIEPTGVDILPGSGTPEPETAGDHADDTQVYHDADTAGHVAMPMPYERTMVMPEHWEHALVLDRALEVYKERNAKYHDNWLSQGWRGNLVKMRVKVERAFTTLWNKPKPFKASVSINEEPAHEATVQIDNKSETDDLIDFINYAVFVIRCVEAGNRDGHWDYGEEK